jgi:hypothetical protein
MQELVYGNPPYTGATNTAKTGMGGVWFIDNEAIVWRAPFPSTVQERLVSYDNPKGTVTSSDLELVATIAHHHVLEVTGLPTAGESTHTFCDNTPTVAWQTKGSTTTTAVTADLLRHGALYQQKIGHVPRYEYLEGIRNVMADNASHLWKLSDENFLTYFNVHYPQTRLWQLHHLQPPVLSELTSLLCCRKSPPALLTIKPRPNKSIGRSGSTFVRTCALTPVYSTSATPSPSCKSSCDGSGMDALPPVVCKSQLDMLRTPYAQWARCWPNWGPGTATRTPPVPADLTSAWPESKMATGNATALPPKIADPQSNPPTGFTLGRQWGPPSSPHRSRLACLLLSPSPREYVWTNSCPHPFTLKDVFFKIATLRY